MKKCPACSRLYEPSANFCLKDGQPLESVEGLDPSVEALDPFVGMVLDDKYEIESLIGKGSIGNVYKARHLGIGLPVAVKILHSSLVPDVAYVARFRREARSATSVQHPNLVLVMDLGVTADKIFYIVMEFVDGVNLADLLESERQLEVARACKLMKQVCLAIDAVHQKNIIHRDLKPSNILIANSGLLTETAKVIDFSLAKMYIDETGDLSPDTIGLASLSPEYLSPEQVEGNSIDPRTDIYCLGIIFYKMLTGAVPFREKTTAALLKKHITDLPRPLREIRPEIPSALEAVVLRALAKNPRDRQQTTALLAEEIEKAVI